MCGLLYNGTPLSGDFHYRFYVNFHLHFFVLFSLLTNKIRKFNMILVPLEAHEITTPDVAQAELGKLSDMAHDVLYPTSRRNLRKRRMEINTLYDRIIAKLNFMGNQVGKDQKRWQELATEAKAHRNRLAKIKDKVQESDMQLF